MLKIFDKIFNLEKTNQSDDLIELVKSKRKSHTVRFSIDCTYFLRIFFAPVLSLHIVKWRRERTLIKLDGRRREKKRERRTSFVILMKNRPACLMQ